LCRLLAYMFLFDLPLFSESLEADSLVSNRLIVRRLCSAKQYE